MEQNSKIPTIFDSELLNEISKTNCGIKYPKNILSCLKSMNFYNHLELCPHYCPVGKIIKICSTSSGISSIWVAASSQVLPINGEALYILKRNSEILKNDFPLIGFRGKNFTRLNVHMFKIDDICIHRTVHQLEIGVKIYFKHWEKCSLHLVEIPREGIKITIREPTTLKLSSEGSKFAEFPKTMEETESKDFLAASSAVAVSLSSSSLSSSSLLSSTAVATTTTTKAASLFTSSSAATTTAKEASLASSKAVVTASLSSSEAVVTASLSSKAVVSESLPTIKEAAATKEASLSSVTTTEAAVLLASLSSSVASKAVVTASLSLSKAVVTSSKAVVAASLSSSTAASSKAVVAASLSSSTAASSKAVVSESLPTTKEAAATKEASLSSVATTEPAKVVASLSTSKAAVTASLSSSTAASSKAVVATSLSLSEAVLAGSLSSSEAVVAASLSSEAAKVLAAASLSSETAKVAVASLSPAETDATTVAAPTFGLSSSSSESSIYCTRGSTSDEITTEESYENFGFVNEESLPNEGPKKTLHDHCHHCPNESYQTNEFSETDCPATETVGELDTNNVPKTHFGINQKSFRFHKTESNTPTNTVSKKLFPKTKKNSSSKYKILSQTDEIIAKVETYLESQVPIPYQKCYPLLESVSVMEKSQLDLDSQVPCLNYNANVKNDQIPNDEIPCYENCLPFENLTMTRFHLMNANFMRKTELKFPQWPVNDLTNYSSGSSMSNVEFYFGAHTTPSYENIKERSQVNSDELLTKIFTFLFRQFDFMIVILLCLLLLFIYYILIHYKGDQ